MRQNALSRVGRALYSFMAKVIDIRKDEEEMGRLRQSILAKKSRPF